MSVLLADIFFSPFGIVFQTEICRILTLPLFQRGVTERHNFLDDGVPELPKKKRMLFVFEKLKEIVSVPSTDIAAVVLRRWESRFFYAEVEI